MNTDHQRRLTPHIPAAPLRHLLREMHRASDPEEVRPRLVALYRDAARAAGLAEAQALAAAQDRAGAVLRVEREDRAALAYRGATPALIRMQPGLRA